MQVKNVTIHLSLGKNFKKPITANVISNIVQTAVSETNNTYGDKGQKILKFILFSHHIYIQNMPKKMANRSEKKQTIFVADESNTTDERNPERDEFRDNAIKRTTKWNKRN